MPFVFRAFGFLCLALGASVDEEQDYRPLQVRIGTKIRALASCPDNTRPRWIWTDRLCISMHDMVHVSAYAL